MHGNPAAGVITPNTIGVGVHRTITRGLAIVQLIIGILSFILGIIDLTAGISDISVCQGIWGGIWIGVTGIIGIISSRNSNNRCNLAGTYMGFSIVSTVVASINFIFSSIDIAISGHCDYMWNDYTRCVTAMHAVLGVEIPVLLLMMIEIFTSIVVAVYSCKRGACCCSQQPGIAIIQSQQPYQMWISSQQGLTTGYSVVTHPPASYPTTNYQPQYADGPQHVQVMATPGQKYSDQVISQPQRQPVSA